jgi:hypothetical protein
MGSKRFYLFLTAMLLIAGIGTGSAMQSKQPGLQTALLQLKSARLHLGGAEADPSGHRAKARELIRQAMAEIKADMQSQH